MTTNKYKPEYVDTAVKLAVLGSTDKMLSVAFDVHEDTIRSWKHQHPEFAEALNTAKIDADANVARSLYNRAMGYSVDSQQAVKYKLPDGGEGVKVVNVAKHVEANVTAAIFWLKNRQPALWRDVQEVSHTGFESLLDEIKNTSRGLPSAHSSASQYGTH